jgi:hypothetical protein
LGSSQKILVGRHTRPSIFARKEANAVRELNGSILLPDILTIADAHDRPDRQGLSKFLSFLGTLALSPTIRYDGTVPQKALDRFLSAANELGLRDVAPLEASSETAFVEELRIAYSMASGYMHTALLGGSLGDGLDPLPEDTIMRFSLAAVGMAGVRTREDRISIALDAYNSGLTGGKLLVGLAAQSGSAELALVVAALADKARANVISRMIDVFRPFLLSSWAGGQGAVYSAPPDAVNRIQDHQRLLWEEIERELIRIAGVRLPRYETNFLEAPMLGALIMMSSRPGDRPRDLITTAASAVGNDPAVRQLSRLFWNLPIVGSHKDHEAVVSETTRDLMERVWSRGGPKREDLRSLLCRASTGICPAIGVPSSAAAAAIAAGENVIAQIAAGAFGLTATALFCVVRAAQASDVPAAAVSTALKRYDEVAPLLTGTVDRLWVTGNPTAS